VHHVGILYGQILRFITPLFDVLHLLNMVADDGNIWRKSRNFWRGGRIVSNYQRNAQFLYSVTIHCSPLSTGIMYGRFQRVTIPDTVIIQFILLKTSIVLLETCCGL